MSIDLGTVASIVDIVGVITAALAAGWYAVWGQKKSQSAENDAVSKNLIDNLQKSLDLTNSDLRATSTKLDQTTKELHIMQGQNEVLKELFGGNENSIMAFVKSAPELIKMTQENGRMLSELTQAITALVKGMPNNIIPAPQLGITS